MPKINPFRPNSIVPPGMFAGRWNEVKRLETGLHQTKAGYPTHFLLTGERGIGKSSLLSYVCWIANGEIPAPDGMLFRFLVVDIDIDSRTTQFGLIKKIELRIRQQLGKSESARTFLSEAWQFIQRVEALGVKINESVGPDPETMLDEFSYSLAETATRVCNSRSAESTFGVSYDGILILVDEADNSNQNLNLGSLIKQLLEQLQRNGCEKVMIVLAGLPELESILRESHQSAVRLFEDLRLNRLKREEIDEVIDRCLEVAARENNRETSIDTEARIGLVTLAEGFPHFIQQFGYSAFQMDNDDNISSEDVLNGAFGTTSYAGALKLIGDRYYRNDFYNKIQKESYRQVLRIMANEPEQWVSKSTIRQKFKGKDSILDNAIKALRSRHIILSKEGVRGEYGLQHRGFALWIKLYATEREKLAADLALAESL